MVWRATKKSKAKKSLNKVNSGELVYRRIQDIFYGKKSLNPITYISNEKKNRKKLFKMPT